MIEDRPIDTDQEIPKVLSRDEARTLLGELVLSKFHGDAQRIWDEIVAPLYDARKASLSWHKGRCRRCFAHHPALTDTRRFGAKSRRMDHSMYCPKYVGPLTHVVAQISSNWAGDVFECTCGQSYPRWADEDATIRGTCPDNALAWRGPQPGDESEESRMTKRNEGQQTPQHADEQVQDQDDAQQSELEKQRLANLRASGQIQEGEQPPGTTGDDQQGDTRK